MSDTQTQPRCPTCRSEMLASGHVLCGPGHSVCCPDPWHRQADAPAKEKPATTASTAGSAREFCEQRYSNIDPVVFIAQPSGKKLYVWDIAEAYAAAHTSELTRERDEARAKLELLNSFYASDADENEDEKLARATKRLIEAERDLAAARSEASQFKKLYEDAVEKLKAIAAPTAATPGIVFSDSGIAICAEIVQRELRDNPEGLKAALSTIGIDINEIVEVRAALGKPEGTK